METNTVPSIYQHSATNDVDNTSKSKGKLQIFNYLKQLPAEYGTSRKFLICLTDTFFQNEEMQKTDFQENLSCNIFLKISTH